MRRRDLEGVYVANVTPFKDDGRYTLDVEAYLAHASWLSESGVRGVVPFGANGEGPSVSLEEKLRVLAALFELKLSLEIVPAVTQVSVPETLEMLAALEGFPATAVLVLPPYFFKPVGAEGLKLFYRAVLAATSHTVLLYNVPKYAVPVPTEVVKALPVWGVKDSGGEPGYAETLLAADRGVLLGTEDDLWRRLGIGAKGVVSALANFVPGEIVEVYRRAKVGEEAGGRELSERLQRVRAKTKEHAAPAVLKKLAEARHGVAMGTVRPPLVPAPSDYDPSPVLDLAEATG